MQYNAHENYFESCNYYQMASNTIEDPLCILFIGLLAAIWVKCIQPNQSPDTRH